MTTIFNLLSLFYAWRSLQIGLAVWRRRVELRQGVLTPGQAGLADQASFYLAVPVGVLVHESGHALTVWLFGGRVVEFGYRLFWGYVVPQGRFSPAQDWFISLAGTLGSLFFGLVVWLLLRRHPAGALRYFALRTLRFQIYFALIYYPLFSLVGLFGDWVAIYDFRATPLLSGLALIGHLAILGGYAWASRRGWFEMVSFETAAEYERFQDIQGQASANPQDSQAQLRLVEGLRVGGAMRQAQSRLRVFLQRNSSSAEGYLQLAILEGQRGRQISPQARRHAETALALGLTRPAAVAYAHRLLAQYALDTGRPDQAIDHLDQALATNVGSSRFSDQAAEAATTNPDAHLYYLRSLAHRQRKRYEMAYQDIEQAIALAQAAGNGQAVAFYQNARETIEKHAGRPLGPAGPLA